MGDNLHHALAARLVAVPRLGGGNHVDLAGSGQPLEKGRAGGEHLRVDGGDGQLDLPTGGHVHFRPAGPDGADGVHDLLHGLLLGGEGTGGVVHRPRGLHQEFALLAGHVGQSLVDLLGDEGHEGVQELQQLDEDVAEDVLGVLRALALHPGLGQLDIPVAVGVPDEVVDLGGGHAQLVGVQVLGDLLDESVQLGEDPFVLQLQLSGQLHLVDGQVHHDEPAGVPDLVGEVAHGLAFLLIEAHVVARAVAGDEVEAQGVRAVLVGDLQGVNAVAQGFGHLPALAVPDQAVDQNFFKGVLLHLLAAGEDHPGNPEEDDIIAGDQHAGRVKVVQLRRLLRPAQGGEGPQGGGEPGVQHVGVPLDICAAALGALGGVLPVHGDVAAVRAGPGGDLVAPPQLAGDAPVVDVLHPVGVSLAETLGDELDFALVDHPQGLLGQGFHHDEPLGGNQGLHVTAAAVTGSYVVAVVLRLDQIALFLQVLHQLLTALVAVHAVVGTAVFVDPAVVADDPDGFQVVPEAHLEVIGVVGGGHLHRAGAKAQLHVIIRYNGDLAVHDGQDAGLAHQVLESLVLRVHGHAGVAHHGFGAGGGYHQIAAAVGQRVANVPQVAWLIHILHLRVGEGGGAVGAPVDDAAALVNEALVVQFTEGLSNRLGAAIVHSEPGPVPVGGDTQLALLLHDAGAVFVFPVPDPLQKFLPAQVVAGDALALAQLLLHLDLGGNARMVRAGEVQGFIALHPLIADQHVLEGVVHGVAHVELSGDVGGRHDDGEGLFVRVRLGVKTARVHPRLVDFPLYLLGLIGLWQFFFHGILLYLVSSFRCYFFPETGGEFRRVSFGQVLLLQQNGLLSAAEEQPEPFRLINGGHFAVGNRLLLSSRKDSEARLVKAQLRAVLREGPVNAPPLGEQAGRLLPAGGGRGGGSFFPCKAEA